MNRAEWLAAHGKPLPVELTATLTRAQDGGQLIRAGDRYVAASSIPGQRILEARRMARLREPGAGR